MLRLHWLSNNALSNFLITSYEIWAYHSGGNKAAVSIGKHSPAFRILQLLWFKKQRYYPPPKRSWLFTSRNNVKPHTIRVLLVLVYYTASYLLKRCLKVKAGKTRHMWKQQTKFYTNLRISLPHSTVINPWKDRATSYELTLRLPD